MAGCCEKGPRRSEEDSLAAAAVVTPTLIHFPPYLAANYEGKEGNKKRAEEGAFPPLSLFCLVRFAAQHDIAERTHEWNGVKEGGWCVGQGRTEEGCC